MSVKQIGGIIERRDAESYEDCAPLRLIQTQPT